MNELKPFFMSLFRIILKYLKSGIVAERLRF